MPDYRKVQELESARILTEQYYADCVKYVDVKPGSPGVSTSLYYAKDHEDVVHNYIFTTYFTETTYLTIIIDTTWLVEVGRVYTEIDGVMATTCFDGSVGYFSGLSAIARDIRKRLSKGVNSYVETV